jgi:hypothetical protein
MDLIKLAPHLYVSGYKCANRHPEFYRICVSDSRFHAKHADSHYPIDESSLPQTFIKHARHVAAEAIRQIERGKSVLLFCRLGRNRSVSCALYILCKYSDLTLREALHRIRRLHPDEAIMREIMDFLEYRFNPRREEKRRQQEAKRKEERRKARQEAKRREERRIAQNAQREALNQATPFPQLPGNQGEKLTPLGNSGYALKQIEPREVGLLDLPPADRPRIIRVNLSKHHRQKHSNKKTMKDPRDLTYQRRHY